MKRVLGFGLAFLLLFLLAGVALARPLPGEERGTIRGGLYEDLDGDGHCLNTTIEDKIPVPGLVIHFNINGASISLYSGSDGTYGLIPVGQGAWQVEALPDPDQWIVTSPNPLAALVTTENGLVQTNLYFCMLRIGGPTNTAQPVRLPGGEMTNDRAGGQDPAAGTRSFSYAERAIISEALLTNPPPPRVPENIAEIKTIPVAEGAPPAPEWLGYLNLFREMGGLSPLVEDESLTYGSQWHSRYMVVNDEPIAHREDSGNVLYDKAGHQAAVNGNIFATTQLEADYSWATNFWVSAPFHLLAIMDPRLSEVGYGQHNEDSGTFKMAAVLDVRSALADGEGEGNYPYFFPGEGTKTWVVRHNLYEWPDPTTSCPGYSRPTGPPLVLQLGDGRLTPNVTGHAVYRDGQLVESCRFDETSYRNPEAFAQRTGRSILDERDAIVIIPRQPLLGSSIYTVQIEANGQSYSWQFSTGSAP